MRVAVISDVHGNLEALEAVLADIRRTGVDEIYCLGDVVGYGADPVGCLERLQRTCGLILRGNHEEAILDPAQIQHMNASAAEALRWTRRQLAPAHVAEIRSWPLVRVGSEARLVHASPDEPLRFNYILNRLDLENAFRAFAEKICFCGHTHTPLVAEEVVSGVIRLTQERDFSPDPACRLLVNVGSVGQPRDGDPRSRWVLVSDQPDRITFKTTAYDVELAHSKILKAGLPVCLADRLKNGI